MLKASLLVLVFPPFADTHKTYTDLVERAQSTAEPKIGAVPFVLSGVGA